jgi:hypothetical protein
MTGGCIFIQTRALAIVIPEILLCRKSLLLYIMPVLMRDIVLENIQEFMK